MPEEENSVDWDKMESDVSDGETGPELRIFTTEMVARRFLWNILPCDLAGDAVVYQGLPHVSADVEKMEHEEAHDRLELADSLRPMIQMMTSLAVRNVITAMIVGHKDTEVAPYEGEVFNETVEQFLPMAYASTYAVICELIDLGMLHMPHIVIDSSLLDRADEMMDGDE